jgi:predicted kinase
MSKPILVMFVGVPGSGKTTFARQLAQETDAVTLNSDAIRLSMWGSREAIRETHDTQEKRDFANHLTFGAMDYAAGQIIGAGTNVVYDCNANKRGERTKMRDIAENHGGLGIVVRIRTPHSVAVERGLNREETHDQPRFVAEKAVEVVERFAREIEEPGEGEYVIQISGEVPFNQQYEVFQKRLIEITDNYER